MKKRKKIFNKYMVVPTISQSFTKTVLALAFVFVWDKIANRDGFFRTWTLIPPIAAVFFVALAWGRFLILDGVRLPRLDNVFSKLRRTARDSTHLSDELDPNGELDETEKDIVAIASSLVCAVILFIITAFMR